MPGRSVTPGAEDTARRAGPPELVLFDLNGTLTDPAAIGAPWGERDLGSRVLDGAIRGGMTDALLGAWRPFSEHVAGALAVEVARRGLDEDRCAEALRAASALPAPDLRVADLAALAARVGAWAEEDRP